jgi:valyl-tRNA synthetase
MQLLPANRWILSRLQTLIQRVEKSLQNFELNDGAQALYEFTWLEFCDWYIEFSKLPLRAGGPDREQTVITLHRVLEQLLTLLHPFMPFVTEELWASLPWKRPANSPTRERDGLPEVETLMLQVWPKADAHFDAPDAERQIEAVKSIVEAIRTFRGENNISPKVEFAVKFATSSAPAAAFVKSIESDIRALARVSSLEAAQGAAGESETVIPVSNPPVELRISLEGLVNVDEEIDRVRKSMDKVHADIEFVRNKLSKESFISKAPPELVAKEREKEAGFVAKLAELEKAVERLARLGGGKSKKG